MNRCFLPLYPFVSVFAQVYTLQLHEAIQSYVTSRCCCLCTSQCALRTFNYRLLLCLPSNYSPLPARYQSLTSLLKSIKIFAPNSALLIKTGKRKTKSSFRRETRNFCAIYESLNHLKSSFAFNLIANKVPARN